MISVAINVYLILSSVYYSGRETSVGKFQLNTNKQKNNMLIRRMY